MTVILRYSEGSGPALQIAARSFAALRMTMLAILALSGCAAARTPTLAITSPTLVTVSNLGSRYLDSFATLDPARQQTTLQVHVAAAPSDAPPLLGDVARHGDAITFTPRYPFQPGLQYRARFDLVSPPLTTDFTLPAPPRNPVARVSAVYPSADELPENLLKFYIHFSAPMSRGDAYRHVHLLDDQGKEIADPFLELGEELWDPAMTRFTLFFHPGRLKHGLVPRAEMGPALVTGRSYTLLIDATWQDGESRPLIEPFRKTFRATPAKTRQPDPARWRITPPPANSPQPLTIDFDEPLDHAMLEHVISILVGDQVVPGKIAITDHERRWSLTPASPWPAGRHDLTIDPNLEDPAGNSIGRPFELDLNQRPAPAADPAPVRIPFDVTPPR